MKKIAKFFIPIFILLLVLTPAVSLAQTESPQIIPCGQSDASGSVSNPCDSFEEVMTLINNLINFVLKFLALPIAAVMFAYAGFKLVTSGGSTEARGTAKNIFTNTAIGLIIAVGAWLIISTILAVLGYEGSWIGLKVSL